MTDLLVRGNAVWARKGSREALAATRALHAQAVALDEKSSAAQTSLGGVLVMIASNGFSADREADLAAGERHLARALALNPQNSMAHFWRGLADAITEELIAGFGGVYNFTVIGLGTAFAYRGRPTELRQLGRELGVRYVLDGTLRRSGEQVLVSLHLQETGSGAQLWADRFALPLAEAAAWPRLVFTRIQRNLSYDLDAIESRQPPAAGPDRPDVTDLLVRGNAAWGRKNSREAMAAARALYAQAVALDDTSTAAQTALGGILVMTASNGFSADREADLAAGERHLARALALNAQNSMAHY